jgi:hypothetical protein
MELVTFHPQQFEPAPPGGVLRSSWRVGARVVTVTQDVTATGVGMMRAEWSPDVSRKLSKAEWREYRAGRAAHWQRLANIVGGPVLLAG